MGQPCGVCNHGLIEIVGCPIAQVTADVWRAMPFADLAREGKLPVGGGILDQTRIGWDAIRRIWMDENRLEREAAEES